MKNKTKNFAIYGIIALAVAGTVFWVAASGNKGQTPGSGAYSAGALVALEKSFDFGAISMENGEVSRVFQVKNEGPGPVTINKVYTSCMCTTAQIKDGSGRKYGRFGMPGHGGVSRVKIEVPSGQSVDVEAIFDPAAHGPSGVGLAQRSVYIETDSETSPRLELSFQAMVTR